MNRQIKIRHIDWLLIIGAMLAPMTGLRVWKIGPAEVLCLIWVIRKTKTLKIRTTFLTKFFSFFLLCLMIGSIICSLKAPLELRMNSWPTWIYLTIISCSLYDHIPNNTLEYNEELFNKICTLSALWYLTLYVFSITISRSFIGAPLWYYHRYSGGGTNPHQLAVLMCGITFWFLLRFSKYKKIRDIFLFFISIFLLNETKSSTGIAAIAIGIFVFFTIWIIQTGQSPHRKALFLVSEIVVGSLIATVFHSKLYRLGYEWVSEDQNGLGRFYIWSSFGQAISKSPIFGLGPGIHGISYFGLKEFHNSYLEIFAATGIVGFLAFMVLSVFIVKQIIRGNPRLLPIMVAMYGYSFAGFAFRRLAYWIVMVFVIVIAQQYSSHNSQLEAEMQKHSIGAER